MSLLQRESPLIWKRALALATGTTGMVYLPKLPAPDGTVWACGGGGTGSPKPEPRRKRRDVAFPIFPEEGDPELDEPNEHEPKPNARAAVFVPDGAVEWLLHEVGHWLAATPAERAQRNYGLTAAQHGHDGDREWQAWSFEEIVLAPFGPSRLFAPPSQRDGAAFAKSGPMPTRHLRHIDARLREEDVDIAAWRAVYGEWVRWGLGKTVRPWDRVN
jgi:hypothetical protein